MAADLTTLGIRHHGPGSARMVLRALEQLRPDAVLVEGPPDADDVLPLAAHPDMRPPVALLVYDPDSPSDSASYPFAEFSPEWQAIRWGLEHRAPVRFIDLPYSRRPRREAPAKDRPDKNPPTIDERPGGAPGPEGTTPSARPDPLDAFAHAAGFTDGEAWWNRVIEENRGGEDPLRVFEAIHHAMESARAALGPTPHDPDEPAREAHMRRSIRAAIKDGFARLAVVCGAWHAPALTDASLRSNPAKADDDLLKPRPKRPTAATWIPWTFDRLSAESGYGAGITSPGWYEHLWNHPDRPSHRWLTTVARLMRDEGLDASPAGVIESVRLADAIAAMRGHAAPGLEDLNDATLAVLCHANAAPLRVIERKLIVGDRLGSVPDDAPAVPLQRDLAASQKSLRLKVTADETVLDLDQRAETDLARSRLLHRLVLLDIPWGQRQDEPRRRTGTFHETWKLQWKPDLAVAVMEAARWGNTVPEAAAARAVGRALASDDLAELTGMLDHTLLADLPAAVERVVARVRDLSAVASDTGRLMDALPPLARVMRYGNVRRTDAATVAPVVRGLLARLVAGLLPACASLDDDAASAMRDRLGTVHAALTSLDQRDLLDPWTAELRTLGDADIHGLVAGRAWRLRLDSNTAAADDAAARFSLALSPGNDPVKASAWLEGFLGGAGSILVHDAPLLGLVDRWVTSLPRETFERVCPIVRRTFSTFEKPERRKIGEKLADAAPIADTPGTPESDRYDAARGDLVVPTIRALLGDLTA